MPGGSWSSKVKHRACHASDLSRQRENLLFVQLWMCWEWLDWKSGVGEALLCCCSPGGVVQQVHGLQGVTTLLEVKTGYCRGAELITCDLGVANRFAGEEFESLSLQPAQCAGG